MNQFKKEYIESCLKYLYETKFPKLNEAELLEEFKILFDDEQIAKDHVVFFHANELLNRPDDNPMPEEKIRSIAKKLLKIRNREGIRPNLELIAENFIKKILISHIHIFLKGVIPGITPYKI